MRRLLNMHRLPTGPTKIALITTAILAIGYLVIGTVVVIAVVYQLTQEVDHRLDRRLLNLQSNATPESGSLPTPHGGHWREPPTRGFNAPTLIWGFSSDGDSYRSESAPELPSIYHHITNPQTVSLSGEEFRIRGGPLNGGWVVVGRASPNIGSTRDTVILTELAMCPLFLGAVFIGAWLIGSYVAKPIEQNHRRQLEFTADASHELRTPLSVIEAETSLALSQPRDLDTYRDALKRVDSESKRLRRLVDDLLWLARFDAAPDHPESEPVDLGIVVQGATDRFRSRAEYTSLRLTSKVVGSMAPIITAPPDWLDRLLGVLLDNACRYSPAGGQIEAWITATPTQVRLVVDDSGPGLPVEDRDRIFDRFYRANSTPNGAGLGLAIADGIVRATGGRWELSKSPWDGARMSVIWPSSSGRDY